MNKEFQDLISSKFLKKAIAGIVACTIITYFYYQTSSRPLPPYIFIISWLVGLLLAYWMRNWHPFKNLLRDPNEENQTE